MLGTAQTNESVKTSLSSVCIWWILYSQYSKTKAFCVLYFLCQGARTKGETLKLMIIKSERNSRKWVWLAYIVFWNCDVLHKHYFVTVNNSGNYAGLMIITSHVSECKPFPGRCSRKFSLAFINEWYLEKSAHGLWVQWSNHLFDGSQFKVPVSFFVIFWILCAVKCSEWSEETRKSNMLSCFT